MKQDFGRLWEFPSTIKLVVEVSSVVERVKASSLRRPWSHDPGSTCTLVTLLHPWIRLFTMIILVWWLRTSNKFTWEEVKGQPESLENRQLLSGSGFVQRMVPPSLSRYRETKLHQTINPPVTSWGIVAHSSWGSLSNSFRQRRTSHRLWLHWLGEDIPGNFQR